MLVIVEPMLPSFLAVLSSSDAKQAVISAYMKVSFIIYFKILFKNTLRIMFSKRSFIALIVVLTTAWWFAQRGSVGYSILWYVTMSVLLQKFPTLIHKTREKLQIPPTRSSFKKMMIAHRGGSWEAPENTL